MTLEEILKRFKDNCVGEEFYVTCKAEKEITTKDGTVVKYSRDIKPVYVTLLFNPSYVSYRKLDGKTYYESYNAEEIYELLKDSSISNYMLHQLFKLRKYNAKYSLNLFSYLGSLANNNDSLKLEFFCTEEEAWTRYYRLSEEFNEEY